MSESTKLFRCLATVASAAESETDFAVLMIEAGKAVSGCLDSDYCIAVVLTQDQVQIFRPGSHESAAQVSSVTGITGVKLRNWTAELNGDVSIVSVEKSDQLYSVLGVTATDLEASLLVIRIPVLFGTGGLLVVSRKPMFSDLDIKLADSVKAIVSSACSRIGSEAQWQR
ncbi:MAG: hypothetical protein HKN43_11650, partial [Rhodothermales bacterium]|nr:hypothetical protein [Rhodothermales bacterium]